MARVLVTDAGRGSAIAFIAVARPPRRGGRRGRRAAPQPGLRVALRQRARGLPVPGHGPGRGGRRAAPRPCATSGSTWSSRSATRSCCRCRAARERFEGVCALALPGPGRARAGDRQGGDARARRAGSACRCPRPRSVATAAEARAAAPRLGWPLVLKPVASRIVRDGGRGALRGLLRQRRGGARRAAWRRWRAHLPVLLQQYHAGEGHGVELLCDRGEPLAVFQHRRLHEVPITGGASALRESVPLDPALLRPRRCGCCAELRWTGWPWSSSASGPAGPVLMEINGRIWGSLPLAVKSGVDFPAELVAAAPRAEASVRRAPSTAARRGSACARATSASSSSGSRRCCARTAATRSCRRPSRAEGLRGGAAPAAPAPTASTCSDRDDPPPGPGRARRRRRPAGPQGPPCHVARQTFTVLTYHRVGDAEQRAARAS